MNRLRWILLAWIGSILVWALFANSLIVIAEETGSGETIPPLQPFQKTVHSESGRIGKAYSGEIVTYTISFHNTSTPSYTAKVGVTDTVPSSLVINENSIHTSEGNAELLPNDLITWVVNVEYGKVYTLTYAARSPVVTMTTLVTNIVDIYEIENVWVVTPTRLTTTTFAVLSIEVTPTLYLPLISKAMEEMNQLQNYRFENGAGDGWDESPGSLIFKREGQYPNSPDGVWVAWLGGAPNANDVLAQEIKLPAEYKSLGLTYLYRVDSGESAPGIDRAGVRITATGVQTKTEDHELTIGNSSGWQRKVIYLEDFRAKSTTFSFWAELNGAVNSNFFVDKVEICSDDEVTNPPTVRRCANQAIP